MNKILFVLMILLTFIGCSKGKGYSKQFVRDVNIEMLEVEGGTYNYEFKGKNYSIKVSSFLVSKFEVTQKIYREVIGKNFSYFQGDYRPVENISFLDAIKFCNELSIIKGVPKAYNEFGQLVDQYGYVTNDLSKVKGYRLLTEAEWEFAYIGGNKSNGFEYSGSNNLDEVGWFINNSNYHIEKINIGGTVVENRIYETNKVGLKKPNELGIYDMAGNVYEYTTNSYVVNSSNKSYLYEIDNKDILIKGGSSRGEASTTKKYYRNSDYGNTVKPDNNGSLPYMGLRIGKSI